MTDIEAQNNINEKYPMMARKAETIAKLTIAHINLLAAEVRNECSPYSEEGNFPYKTQHILEEVIKILQSKV